MAIQALTLHRPWDLAIVHGPKRIENRSWKPPLHLIGDRLVIHAGKKFDSDAVERIAERWPGLRGFALDNHVGACVGTVKVLGWIERRVLYGQIELQSTRSERQLLTRSSDRSDPVVRAALRVACGDEPWFTGPVGWVLDDPKPYAKSPVVKGKQGLWYLTPHEAKQLREIEDDVQVDRAGSVATITPLTSSAVEWVEENVLIESWQRVGNGFVLEPGCVDAVLDGMKAAGLLVRSSDG